MSFAYLQKIIVLLLIASTIHSQVFAAEADGRERERIDYLQQSFDRGQSAAKTWWWGWLGGYAGLTAGQMAIYAATPNDSDDNKTLRDIMLVGGVSSAIGVGWQLVSPLTASSAADELRLMPERTAEERRQKLQRAEELMAAAAAEEKFGRSWLAHFAGFSVNLAAGLIIWQAMHHTFVEGFINFAAGMVISETQIYTQPTHAIDDFATYQGKYGRSAAQANMRNGNWFLQFGGTSLRVGIWF